VSQRRRVSLNTIASGEIQTKPAGAATIFIHNGAPQALLGSYVNYLEEEADPRARTE
jgi:hypothetical protein